MRMLSLAQLTMLPLLAASATSALAQTAITTPPPGNADANIPIVVLVRVPAPWYAPKFYIASKMREEIPRYENLDGLVFKAWTVEAKHFGGIYLWQSYDQAAKWFGPAWFERVKRTRGVDGQVTYMRAPFVLDNTPGGTARADRSEAVVTRSLWRSNANINQTGLVDAFKRHLSTLQTTPGLLRAYLVHDLPQTHGIVLVWRDQAAANAATAKTAQQVLQEMGSAQVMESFASVLLTPSTNQRNRIDAVHSVIAQK